MKKHLPYSSEFKQDAAELVLGKDYTVQEAYDAECAGPTDIRRWVRTWWHNADCWCHHR